VNLQTFIRVNRYIERVKKFFWVLFNPSYFSMHFKSINALLNKLLLISILLISISAPAGWDIDFSHRSKEMRKTEYNKPINAKADTSSVFDFFFNSGTAVQEVVILNTKNGFVPSTINVRQGYTYKINVVNVNEKEKNVSFVLDAFSEHHATYYGKIKSFHIEPKKQGVYSFQCPETSAQGNVVVYATSRKQQSLPLRQPSNID